MAERIGISATVCPGQTCSPSCGSSPRQSRWKTRMPACGALTSIASSPARACWMASSAFFFSTWMSASLERVSFFSIASASRACSILARDSPSSMLDSMISWREKISSSLGWNLRVLSSSISAMSAVASRLSSAASACRCSRDSLAPAAARSASPSLSWRSKSVGSKRSTTSPAATREPSGAIQAIFIGRGRPRGGGGVMGSR